MLLTAKIILNFSSATVKITFVVTVPRVEVMVEAVVVVVVLVVVDSFIKK